MLVFRITAVSTIETITQQTVKIYHHHITDHEAKFDAFSVVYKSKAQANGAEM